MSFRWQVWRWSFIEVVDERRADGKYASSCVQRCIKAWRGHLRENRSGVVFKRQAAQFRYSSLIRKGFAHWVFGQRLRQFVSQQNVRLDRRRRLSCFDLWLQKWQDYKMADFQCRRRLKLRSLHFWRIKNIQHKQLHIKEASMQVKTRMRLLRRFLQRFRRQHHLMLFRKRKLSKCLNKSFKIWKRKYQYFTSEADCKAIRFQGHSTSTLVKALFRKWRCVSKTLPRPMKKAITFSQLQRLKQGFTSWKQRLQQNRDSQTFAKMNHAFRSGRRYLKAWRKRYVCSLNLHRKLVI